MSQVRFETWHRDLQELLGLAVPPVAIAFIGHLTPRRRSHRTNHAAANGGWTHGCRGGELRILDRSHARCVRHDRGGPRQLQRRLPDAWFQDYGRDCPHGRRRRALRERK